MCLYYYNHSLQSLLVQSCNYCILICFTSWCVALWGCRKCCRNNYGRCKTAVMCIKFLFVGVIVDILRQILGSLFCKPFPKYASLSTVLFCRWCSSLGDDSYYRRPEHDAVQFYDLLVAQCRQQNPPGEVSACQLRRQKIPSIKGTQSLVYRMEKDRPL
jgi:hypothetical protein